VVIYGKKQFIPQNGHFMSCAPFGGLGATHAVHLRLIGKLLMGFPLVIIDFLFVFEEACSIWAKMSGKRAKRDRSHQPFFPSEQ